MEADAAPRPMTAAGPSRGHALRQGPALRPLETRFSPRLARALCMSRLIHCQRSPRLAELLGCLQRRPIIPKLQIDAPGGCFSAARCELVTWANFEMNDGPLSARFESISNGKDVVVSGRRLSRLSLELHA